MTRRHVLGGGEDLGTQFFTDGPGLILRRSGDLRGRLRRGLWRRLRWRLPDRLINLGADGFLEPRQLFPILCQLVKELIAQLLVFGVAQQSPELVLSLGERDQPGDVVARIAHGDLVVCHRHPFGCRSQLLLYLAIDKTHSNLNCNPDAGLRIGPN